MTGSFLRVATLMLVLVLETFASKILVVVPTPSHSHQTQFRILTNALLAKGHKVTLFTARPLKTSQENLTEVDISQTTKLKNDFDGLADKSPEETLPDLRDVGYVRAHFQLNEPAVRDFIRRNHTFDLVIFERMPYQAYYGLFHRVGSPPLVGFVTFSALAPTYYTLGNAMNPAYLPEVWVGLSDHMTWERLYNTYFYLRFYRTWFYQVLPKQETLVREVFGTEPPSIYETERNYSLLIVSNHFSLEYPRPQLPNVIEITGIHVSTKIEKLPKNIQDFLDGAEHGVVYCSLGSNVRSKDLPLEKIQALMEAFRELPQRVIWKWENDSLPSQPENVMVSKWLPRQSILDQPKVRLFISQGGLQSMNEATYHAVPLLVIPFFGDLPHTAAKVAQAEIGVRLQFRDLTKDSLIRSIRTVLGDTKYADNMKRLSAVFREHRADSLERAVWWVECVIRHRGAPHLCSAALDLHWRQLLLIDVVAFLVVVAALTLCLVYFVTRRVVSSFKDSLVLSHLLLLVLVHSSFASKILVIAPSPAISHQKPFHTLTQALLQRGHEITFLTPNPLNLAHENLTEIDLAPAYKLQNEVNFVDWAYMSPVETLNLIFDLCYDVVQVQLSQPAVQDFIRRKPTFDLMIIERLSYQAYYGLAHLVGSPPLVGLVTMTNFAPVYHMYGSPMNPAYLPDLWVGFSDHMTFWQRLYNTYFYLRLYYMWFCRVIPEQESVMREFFGAAPPPVYETEFNFSLLITNNDFSLEYARPLTPNIIEINGIHVPVEVEPLSEDIQKFLDGAEHGVIYFSLGSNVKSTNLPPEMIQDILQVFRQLPQRVLWKWENDSLPSQPENVMIRKWLQQPSVLAHPKVRLFIMQGGLQSLNEATYHAVPLVVIPVFSDQHHNAAKIAQSQIGVRLNIQDVTKDTLLRSIRTVLEDTTYKDNMKRLSAVFREHRADSRERAVWWVEYVIRHKGAPHLRSAALDLHWWQLMLLDVVAFLLVVAALTLYVVYSVARRIASVFKGNKQKQKKQ
ncbi:uncharacterized protein LOC124777597 [Schistocerca piceifrons]|uniref:uncharacterized protein LOC124777597 n=1 Tax=Schistocerca piceifrons TaxID=274613 RepID=UPI001F5E7775|nr:uncharacterized protein LOC124777597 [Schistocerca piceifrons]